jgi:hypothetical protein
MAGDLGTPDIGGESKSSSLYVVSQLAIGNQRREPASKKVRHGITTISDLCLHVFFLNRVGPSALCRYWILQDTNVSICNSYALLISRA